MKPSRLPASSQTSHRKAEQACERLWRAKVLERGGGKCLLSPNHPGPFHAAHIIGRAQSLNVKLDLANGCVLCQECHAYAHAHPHEWEYLIQRMIGAERYAALLTKSRTVIHSPPTSWFEERYRELEAA